MSTAIALGRYWQLAVNQRKDHTVAELRCAHKRCLLASVLEFDTRRVVLVQAHTNSLLTKKKNQPLGPNALARQETYPGLTAELLDQMPPGEVLALLESGELREAHLEAVFRHSGGNVARLAYVAEKDDFKGYSPNRFTRCDHISGYLKPEAFNATQRVSLLTQDDLTR